MAQCGLWQRIILKWERTVTGRYQGFAYVEFIGVEAYSGEAIVGCVHRVPCVGESVRVNDEAPQKVKKVVHAVTPSGPEGNEIDAWVYLSPYSGVSDDS